MLILGGRSPGYRFVTPLDVWSRFKPESVPRKGTLLLDLSVTLLGTIDLGRRHPTPGPSLHPNPKTKPGFLGVNLSIGILILRME